MHQVTPGADPALWLWLVLGAWSSVHMHQATPGTRSAMLCVLRPQAPGPEQPRQDGGVGATARAPP